MNVCCTCTYDLMWCYCITWIVMRLSLPLPCWRSVVLLIFFSTMCRPILIQTCYFFKLHQKSVIFYREISRGLDQKSSKLTSVFTILGKKRVEKIIVREKKLSRCNHVTRETLCLYFFQRRLKKKLERNGFRDQKNRLSERRWVNMTKC